MGLQIDQRPACNDGGDKLGQIKRMAEASLTTQWLLESLLSRWRSISDDLDRPMDRGRPLATAGTTFGKQGLAERRAGDEEDTERRENGEGSEPRAE